MMRKLRKWERDNETLWAAEFKDGWGRRYVMLKKVGDDPESVAFGSCDTLEEVEARCWRSKRAKRFFGGDLKKAAEWLAERKKRRLAAIIQGRLSPPKRDYAALAAEFAASQKKRRGRPPKVQRFEAAYRAARRAQFRD